MQQFAGFVNTARVPSWPRWMWNPLSLPVHPHSFYLLGSHWLGFYFFGRCLTMGCLISCSLFEIFSSFLEWVVREVSGLRSIIHCLDDFLCIGPANSSICGTLLAMVQHMAEVFVVPLAPDKTEGSSSVLSFFRHLD